MSAPRAIASLAVVIAAAALQFGAAACHAATTVSSSGLHYAAEAGPEWSAGGPGSLRTVMLGVDVAVRLPTDRPSLEVGFDNPGGAAIEVRLGPEVTSRAGAAIGEYRQRRRGSGEGATDYLPYLSQHPVELPPGARLDFYLDEPLGRPAMPGQYFVVVVELRRGDAAERRLLPVRVASAAARRR